MEMSLPDSSALHGTNKNGLPPFWDARVDKSGRIYFVNHQTKTTQWGDPRPLPEGWQMKYDERMKRHYYINHVAKSTTWDDPRQPLNLKREDAVVGHGPRKMEVKADIIADHSKQISTGNSDHDREWYKDVLRMALMDKTLQPEEEQLLAAVRKKLNINDAVHEQALREVGWTVDEFKHIRKDNQESNRECVICLDASANMVLMDCMHICLCEDCSKTFDKTKTCPKCRSTVREIRKTF